MRSSLRKYGNASLEGQGVEGRAAAAADGHEASLIQVIYLQTDDEDEEPDRAWSRSLLKQLRDRQLAVQDQVLTKSGELVHTRPRSEPGSAPCDQCGHPSIHPAMQFVRAVC